MLKEYRSVSEIYGPIMSSKMSKASNMMNSLRSAPIAVKFAEGKSSKSPKTKRLSKSLKAQVI